MKVGLRGTQKENVLAGWLVDNHQTGNHLLERVADEGVLAARVASGDGFLQVVD